VVGLGYNISSRQFAYGDHWNAEYYFKEKRIIQKGETLPMKPSPVVASLARFSVCFKVDRPGVKIARPSQGKTLSREDQLNSSTRHTRYLGYLVVGTIPSRVQSLLRVADPGHEL
jgi:hypothetical protein